jgi:hypothetical protein
MSTFYTTWEYTYGLYGVLPNGFIGLSGHNITTHAWIQPSVHMHGLL